ncbi:site-specific DNA-methyltransferase [Aliarcobacter cryaerophilus]|uniref:DNA methyltransferase n=1 Tax=Aliarcobacter cryaerophilus TaxID=28198 RepID=UPI003DA4A600
MLLSFKQHIENLFKNSQTFSDSNKVLFIPKILEAIEKIDIELVKILKNDDRAKKHFFTQIDDIYVLNQNKLIEFFTLNDYMKNGSYTSYTNKIGLIKKDNFIKKFDDVVLAFPHKDCVLEGGQTKDDDKKKEVFYNEILSSDEIDRLFEPKVLTNIKRYSKDGAEENCEIKNDDNLIIKGNNLIALHSLKKKFAGKVKLIYIDPPYNTGNDSFKYNDNFNHSTWLTFMKNRLEVAKDFLSDYGVIFVQCDYNEQAYIKVLMDEIFGRDKFINEIIWKRKFGNANETRRLGTAFDNIFLYGKTNEYAINLINEKESNHVQEYIKKRFTRKVESGKHKGKLWMPYPLANPGKPTKNLMYEYKGYKPPEKGWRMIKEKLELLDLDERIYFPNDKNQRLQEKKFLDEYEGQPVDALWTDIFVINSQSKEAIDFDGQKPEDLLKRILLISTDENDLVMDFHLGSGTTCAVAHKMGRRYIGIEQMDYIEDIAVERLKKVIDGEQGGISKALNWKGGGDFVYAELKQIDIFKDVEIGALNKNMQYLPISEIEDETYNLKKEEIEINKKFYGIENE